MMDSSTDKSVAVVRDHGPASQRPATIKQDP
jgi:hypothetical protein